MTKYLWFLLPAVLGLPTITLAEETPPRLLESINQLLPGMKPERVSQSPIPGLYEVMYNPRLILYVHEDGKYVIQGELLNLKTQANLTEERRKQARLKIIEGLGEDSMIVFAPEKTAHTITVFTDVDCGYCRKLHQEVNELTRHGIKVRYLAFPRAGIGSPTYEKMVSVWCAKDRQQAITDAKAGSNVPTQHCDNPVQAHYEAAQQMGISGTPAMVLDDGGMQPGYVPADQLIKLLETEASS
ncbi:MAG: DsbC family protein [Gammaproteobacteria bacterium]|jgi:thiol:disulfide interchange protein DsbC